MDLKFPEENVRGGLKKFPEKAYAIKKKIKTVLSFLIDHKLVVFPLLK